MFSSGRKDLRRRHFLVVVVEDVGHRFFFVVFCWIPGIVVW